MRVARSHRSLALAITVLVVVFGFAGPSPKAQVRSPQPNQPVFRAGVHAGPALPGRIAGRGQSSQTQDLTDGRITSARPLFSSTTSSRFLSLLIANPSSGPVSVWSDIYQNF